MEECGLDKNKIKSSAFLSSNNIGLEEELLLLTNLFATSEPPKYSNSNSPNLCFCLLKDDKKTFLFVENIFWTNENVFLSPFNKQKQRFGELEFEYLGGYDVVNKLDVRAQFQGSGLVSGSESKSKSESLSDSESE